MEMIELDRIFPEGRTDPESFRQGLEKVDWEQYRDKFVLIKGCGTMPIPTWAYLLALVRLMGVAKVVAHGEPHTATIIWRRT